MAGFADRLVPVFDRQLAGHHGETAFVAVFQDVHSSRRWGAVSLASPTRPG